ncbi:putative bifunctional diguanylate cyclase/phosphodiesterase [Chromobacterium paludis]|uniref:GGDEF domain-containing protein n=1 Tax=Chromobacterium paludis TaxID=2605945 RepID=A0A5C1DFR0_9NEIS|nr:bifunctional diguanylate cyclase/phosphodiesterase [Chromobacterium paludis]QEL55632.1 GGDEF domain-containing protein [Chromobacterium paludis]
MHQPTDEEWTEMPQDSILLSAANAKHAYPWLAKENASPVVRALLRYQATHDIQTDLPNLDWLIEKTDQALAKGEKCSLIFLLVLGINEIGEQHGIAAALHALLIIAQRLQETMQDVGLAARIQGELFVAASAAPDPLALAERLRSALTQPLAWRGHVFHLEVSIGLARSEDVGKQAESLIQAGYIAAKDELLHNPRGGVRLFTQELGQKQERQYQIQARLPSAIQQGALSLALQAKVGARDGRVHGAEALVRWRDAQLGDISPAEFIPLAERNGTITDISLWVLRQALAEAAAWQRAGLNLSVAVNLSAIDLQRPQLIDDVRAALAQAGGTPDILNVELTESAVAQDPQWAIEQLRALKRLGVGLSLDDFGTGYSSLSYLRRFPIDTLKIDQSFVADTPGDTDAGAIVRAIIALAKTLGMKTVAEGVETGEQALFLRKLGVDELQGYLFSRPLPPETFLSLAQGFQPHTWAPHASH